MKQIGQIANNIATMSIKPSTDELKPVVNENAANFIDYVFDSLKALFPAWKNAWPTVDIENRTKREWVKAFVENGIKSSKQVKLGIKACRSLETDFIPSVGKFISLCRVTPENLGLPNADEAFKIASFRTKKILHPVLEATIKAVDSYALKIGKVTPKQFEYTYMIMVNRYANGERLTNEVPKAITNGELKGLDAVLQQSENEAKRRVQLQGISTNAIEARRQALAVLGLKDRKQEARA